MFADNKRQDLPIVNPSFCYKFHQLYTGFHLQDISFCLCAITLKLIPHDLHGFINSYITELTTNIN